MLFLKLMLVPCLITLVALLGKRYGTTVTGLLSDFLIIAAPTICFLSIEQGAPYAYCTLRNLLSLALKRWLYFVPVMRGSVNDGGDCKYICWQCYALVAQRCWHNWSLLFPKHINLNGSEKRIDDMSCTHEI